MPHTSSHQPHRCLAALIAGTAIALTGCTSADGGVAVTADRTLAEASRHPLERPLYVDPESSPAQQARRWAADPARSGDRALIQRLAAQPMGVWLTDDASGPLRAARTARAADRRGRTPVFVAYNIPGRDCGLYSAGGAADGARYRRWVARVAAAIGARPAIVVLEPDAVSQAAAGTCGGQQAGARLGLLRDAVRALGRNPNTRVYLDAGNADWIPPRRMAPALRRAGIAQADGFAVNVSNFETTASSTAYGERLSRLVGGKPFVVDTSRNGNGPYADGSSEDWCNPPGRALGRTPTTVTGRRLVDAYLWVKIPGESDGTCRGGPPAGAWWPEYALGLISAAESRP